MRTDAVAVSLSGLCLVHCLALPLFSATFPLLGAIADIEWVHRALVAFAVPIAVFAFAHMTGGWSKAVFGLAAGVGAALLIAGAFIEALHDYEIALTTAGALLLAGAHLFRWQTHQQ